MRALVFFALVGAALAAPRQATRIVGGEETSIEEYPYMSNMQYGLWGIVWYQACGGSLITETAVLSAAHCYYGDSASSWRVILGTSLESGTDGSTHTVSRLSVHEQYNSWTIDNDIAIVHLATRATLSNVVALASIPGANYNLADGTMVTAIGWGTLYSGGPSPDRLRHVEIPIVNQEVCAARYRGFNDITPGMLCLGFLDEGGKDACQGDSGGPVAHGTNKNIIYGVTSWGIGCADAYYPGVNARTNYYVDWILANAS